jgi:hypothetical protein
MVKSGVQGLFIKKVVGMQLVQKFPILWNLTVPSINIFIETSCWTLLSEFNPVYIFPGFFKNQFNISSSSEAASR